MNTFDPDTSRSTSTALPTQYLERPGGRMAYEVAGNGPLVILVPGMGDLRSSYRFLAPPLRRTGARVACCDLRGHGDSDVTFGSYSDADTASDIVALIDALGGPATVVGNSMGASAAALAAADRPDLVSGLVLVGPFLRDPAMGAVQRALVRVAMAPPWIARAWGAYLPKLYAGQRPADFDEYRRRVVANLRRPGYGAAFSRTAKISHAGVEARLHDVRAPALVLMGELDPDFRDPVAEADWAAHAIGAGAEVVMVPEAGHYPQAQRPDITVEAITRFLATGRDHA